MARARNKSIITVMAAISGSLNAPKRGLIARLSARLDTAASKLNQHAADPVALSPSRSARDQLLRAGVINLPTFR